MVSLFAVGPAQPSISYSDFSSLTKPRRICFGSMHKNALKPYDPKWDATFFNIPFKETIGPLVTADHQLTFTRNQYGQFSARIVGHASFISLEAWIRRRAEHVYLKDCLALSSALGENFTDDDARSRIGSIEYAAKYERDEAAVDELGNELVQFIKAHAYYRTARYICPVPASPGSDWPLTHMLAERIANELGVNDLRQHGVGR